MSIVLPASLRVAPPALRFPGEPGLWHAASETMQLLADPVTPPVMIAVSRETLARLAKVRRLDETDCRHVFERHREYFRWLADRKHRRGDVGPFRTILITPDDLGDAADRREVLGRRAARETLR